MSVKPVNRSISIDENDIDSLISELSERNELACTGNSCPVHSCAVVLWEDLMKQN